MCLKKCCCVLTITTLLACELTACTQVPAPFPLSQPPSASLSSSVEISSSQSTSLFESSSEASSSVESSSISEIPSAPSSSSSRPLSVPKSSSTSSSTPEISSPPEPSATSSLFSGDPQSGQPVFSLSTNTAKMGDNIFIFVHNIPTDEQITAQTNMNFTPTFYPYGDRWVAAMPIRYTLAPGNYKITVSSSGLSHTFPITVTDAGFKTETFTVNQSVADSTVNDGGANAEYEEITRPLKNMGDNQKYWDGRFVLPVHQDTLRISSSFGYTRIVNGVPSIHGGVDFPAPGGTPVTAPNRGRVLYAGYLKLTGNTVVIEHGFGLKSWYYHMSALDCETGDMLETGDPIGKVGTTGFSTGNHLHFAMSVNNVYVNPWQYIENDMLT